MYRLLAMYFTGSHRYLSHADTELWRVRGFSCAFCGNVGGSTRPTGYERPRANMGSITVSRSLILFCVIYRGVSRQVHDTRVC